MRMSAIGLLGTYGARLDREKRRTVRVGGTGTHPWHDADLRRWLVEAEVGADAGRGR